MNTQSIESVTMAQSLNLSEFLNCLHLADKAELIRFDETERAVGLLKLMRQQYSTLQLGTQKTLPPQAGEMPAVMYLNEIENLYERRKQMAEATKQEFTLKWDSFRDAQVRHLKFYIETGEIFNRKKETLQERAMTAIAKLEKKAAAEAKAAEAAKAKAAKAAEAKAKAEAKAAEAKAKADALLIDAQNAADAMNENGGVEEFLTLADAQEAAEAEAEADAAEAEAEAKAEAKAEAEAKAAEAKAAEAKAKVAEARLKAEALARGKASNNKTEPNLNFKTTNFSQDCKDTALMLLTDLEKDCSAPELLYLANLILDKYNK